MVNKFFFCFLSCSEIRTYSLKLIRVSNLDFLYTKSSPLAHACISNMSYVCIFNKCVYVFCYTWNDRNASISIYVHLDHYIHNLRNYIGGYVCLSRVMCKRRYACVSPSLEDLQNHFCFFVTCSFAINRRLTLSSCVCSKALMCMIVTCARDF